MKNILFALPIIALGGCAYLPDWQWSAPQQEAAAEQAPADQAPQIAPPAPPPPPTARTVEAFDTTSTADRQAAVAQVPGAATTLGTTTATLGTPADPGIWLRTPLVTEAGQGRIRFGARTINVELRPSGGAPGSGSQISLAAMRLIEAPLTSVITLVVLR